MAQHDMNIANQGFPAFRADLNDALGALVSNSSGATAPATTFAHQLWVDTAADPSILKIRNADNDAWITIGSINQTDDKFKLTPADGVSTDTISELTSAAGVTIDGVLLKDTTVTANTIKASGTSSTQGEVQLFEDTDNGTNYVAIKAPASIAANVTWTLPNADGTADQVLTTDGSGVLGWSDGGGGKVLQVVSATKTDTFTTTSTSFVDITGLSASITPTSATSKILCFMAVQGSQDVDVNRVHFRFARGGTGIGIGDASGSRTPITASMASYVSAMMTTAASLFLDSPASTSALTYTIQIRSSSATTVFVNRNEDDTDIAASPRGISTLTLMEIAA